MELTPINAPNTHHHGGYRWKDVIESFPEDKRKAITATFIADGFYIQQDEERPTSLTIYTPRCMCGVIDQVKVDGLAGGFINLLYSQLQHERSTRK